MKKSEITQQINVLELLNKELPRRFPTGSMVVFTAQRPAEKEESEYDAVFNCNWYNKKGKDSPLQDTISKPPEWQGLTFKEAESICRMFDDCMIINRSVIIAHEYCQVQTGIKLNGQEKFEINN